MTGGQESRDRPAARARGEEPGEDGLWIRLGLNATGPALGAASRTPLTMLIRLGQSVAGDSSRATLHSVVDELVRFRLRVRQFALATGAATREARQQQLLDRQPLLEACDTLRRDLVAHGISIKVSRCHCGLLAVGTATPRAAYKCATVRAC